MARSPVIPTDKSIAVYVLLALLLPGAGDVYLGKATRRAGWMTLAAFALSFPLIFAFGLGLFLLAFLWLSSVVRGLIVVLRTMRAG